jgi:hypothetical protein
MLLPILAVVCAVMTLTAFMLPRAARQNLALGAGGVILAIGGAELALTVARPGPGMPVLAASGDTFDTRTRLEVIREMEQAGQRANADLHGRAMARGNILIRMGSDSLLPLSPSASNSTVVLCNEEGFWVHYESDEAGFRNPPGNWTAEPGGMAAIGDSFTMGVCQPTELSFAGLLRDAYPDLVNLGVAGTGPLMQLGTLREYASHLKPRTVLWFFYEGNDFADLHEEQAHPILRRYLEPEFSQDLLRHRVVLDQGVQAHLDGAAAAAASRGGHGEGPTRAVRVKQQTRELLKLTKLRSLAGITIGYRPEPGAAEQYAQILDLGRQAVASWGGELVVIYLPTYNRYARRGSGTTFQGRDIVLAAAAGLDIPIIDLVPAFDRQSRPLEMWTHGLAHYSEAGNRLVATTVGDALLQIRARGGALVGSASTGQGHQP